MKAIELVPVDAVTNQVREVEILGHTRYEPGRDYPWYAHNVETGVSQYFLTQSEAVRFASTGVA
jgi:hypothetical protein